jgi:hypothetical protein
MMRPTSSIPWTQCNAWYESESKLREHRKVSHRGSEVEKRSEASSAVDSEDSKR